MNSWSSTTSMSYQKWQIKKVVDWKRKNLYIKALCQTQSKTSDVSRSSENDSPQWRKAKDQEAERKKRSSIAFLTKVMLVIRYKIRGTEIILNLLVKDVSKNLES